MPSSVTDLARLRELARGWLAGCHRYTAIGQGAEMDVDNLAALLATATEEAVAAERLMVEELRDALEWVVPMAKGYANEHPVGKNWNIARAAEERMRAASEYLNDPTAVPRAAAMARVVEAARSWRKVSDDYAKGRMGVAVPDQLIDIEDNLLAAVDALDAAPQGPAEGER